MSQNWRLKSVTGPEGRLFTLADLPPADVKRWLPCHKASIATVVRGGLISADEICRRYKLTLEELRQWERALDIAQCAPKGKERARKLIELRPR